MSACRWELKHKTGHDFPGIKCGTRSDQPWIVARWLENWPAH